LGRESGRAGCHRERFGLSRAPAYQVPISKRPAQATKPKHEGGPVLRHSCLQERGFLIQQDFRCPGAVRGLGPEVIVPLTTGTIPSCKRRVGHRATSGRDTQLTPTTA